MKLVILSSASVNEPHRTPYDHLAKNGRWEVHIVAPESISIGSGRRKPCDPRRPDAGYRLHLAPLIGESGGGRFSLFGRLARTLRTIRPDIVFAEQDPASVAVLQAKALAPRAKCVAFTVENIQHHRWSDAFRALTERRPKAALRDAVVGSLTAVGEATVDGLACISNEGRRIFLDAGWRKPLEVVPLGTDTTAFCPRDASDVRGRLGLHNRFVVGYFGRLVPEKGVHLLVETLPSLPDDAVLLLDMFANFAPGSYADSLLTRAAELGVRDRIVTVDAPHQDIPMYMAACDTLVLPSLTTPRWKEQFGRVLPEAMSCCVPVIGSGSGNIPDMIGDAGLIVEEGSTAALSRAILRLRADVALRKALGARGRQRVLDLFSVEAQVRTMERLFEQVQA